MLLEAPLLPPELIAPVSGTLFYDMKTNRGAQNVRLPVNEEAVEERKDEEKEKEEEEEEVFSEEALTIELEDRFDMIVQAAKIWSNSSEAYVWDFEGFFVDDCDISEPQPGDNNYSKGDKQVPDPLLQ